jgi:hypothetical protein
MQQWGFSESELNAPDIGAPHADPDRAGIPNLLEYALDGNPLNPHVATLPSAEHQFFRLKVILLNPASSGGSS